MSKIFTFYIFDAKDKCIFYHEWNRTKPVENQLEEEKLIIGLLKAIGQFNTKTAPSESSVFQNYTTSTYKLHYFETGTGLKFVLLSDPRTPALAAELRQIYSDYYVEYVSKNPLYQLGTPITCNLFLHSLDSFVKALKI
jgi:hypothetical protein